MPFAYRQADGELYVLLSLQRTRRRVKQAEEAEEAVAPAAGPARQTLAYTFLGKSAGSSCTLLPEQGSYGF